MTTIELKSQVTEEGILHLIIPSEFKGLEVNITITIVESNQQINKNINLVEWLKFIDETAGSIDDNTFIRQPQVDGLLYEDWE